MKTNRYENFLYRYIVLLSLFLVGSPFFSASALSAEYPSRPIEIVTHSAPGGPNNLICHLISEIVQKEKVLPQPVFITLKPGSGMAAAFSYLFEKG